MKKIAKLYRKIPEWMQCILTIVSIFVVPMILIFIMLMFASCEFFNQKTTVESVLSDLTDDHNQDNQDNSYQRGQDIPPIPPVGDKPLECLLAKK